MNQRQFAKENGINPHAWEKFKQAERNMMKAGWLPSGCARRSRRIKAWQRAGKWARELNRWLPRLCSRRIL